MMDFVRRRRWFRKRRRVGAGALAKPPQPPQSSSGALPPALLAQASSTSTPSIRTLQSAADQRVVEGSQTPLGMVTAGDSVPLPQGWSARGSQLQVLTQLPVVTIAPP